CLRQLREYQLLALRVHAHVRADRARGRGGRRPRSGRRAGERLASVRRGAADGAAGLLVEVADDRGDPQPARGTRALLSFAPSYAVLCAAQALIVLAARPPTTRGRRGLAGALLPAAALGVAVAIIRAVAGGPHSPPLPRAVATPLRPAPARPPLARAP